MMQSIFRRHGVLAVSVLLALGAAVGGAVAFRSAWEPILGFAEAQHDEPHADEEGDDSVLTVKAVHPKRNKQELVRSVTQPAFVQPLYRAELMARVAGPVKAVHKNIGDKVKKGEVLLEIDVPELVQDVALKSASVLLAEQEVRAAQAAVKAVIGSEKEAAALVREKQSDVQRAVARKKYQLSAYNRVKALADSRAVEPSLVDERLRQMEVADAEQKSAEVAVETAQANFEEFHARMESAQADVEVRRAKVEVAKADRDRAQALAEFAKLRAPFDGMVVARQVDPGAFVQNASTGQPRPLMTLVRTDQVTLVMWVPEREAPLVRDGADAVVRLDALGRRELAAKVSRMSHFLDPEKSRDMRVEVDLPNKDGALKVGMYGSMTLLLQRFEQAPLLPASAVVVRGGRPCICELVDGKAHFVPVRVQLEDGIVVKVAKLVKRAGSDQEVPVELTGDETVVRSGQGEVHEGQEVRATVEAW